MESVLNLSIKDAAMAAINQKLILQGISWDFYEQILEEYKDSNAVHFAYDDGFLEVDVPLAKHEIPIGILSDLVTTICVESDKKLKRPNSCSDAFDRPIFVKIKLLAVDYYSKRL